MDQTLGSAKEPPTTRMAGKTRRFFPADHPADARKKMMAVMGRAADHGTESLSFSGDPAYDGVDGAPSHGGVVGR